MNEPNTFWAVPAADLLVQLKTQENGLSDDEALQRRKTTKSVKVHPIKQDLLLLLKQFRSPLELILIIAVILSSLLAEYTNSVIILLILLFTGVVGFVQERKANIGVRKLLEMVKNKALVVRNGISKEILINEVASGDIILLNAGDIIPGDCRLLDAEDLHVTEAALTGESFPQEKGTGILPVNTPLGRRTNCAFEGTSVINGTAKAVIVTTGADTAFGSIAASLAKHPPETAFEKGIRKFGYLLMEITLVFSLIVTSLNVYLGKPFIDSFLFGVSFALGMTPELLPAIVTITLAAGAKRMADKKVIVKRLSAIQNLGSIDVFCADKTGTLTDGMVKVHATVNIDGDQNEKVKRYAYLNASFETGFTNPLDEALRAMANVNIDGCIKFDEVPYDFVRKRLSVVVAFGQRHIMITKGAVKNIVEVCDKVELDDQVYPLVAYSKKIIHQHETYSSEGFRTIGLAYKDVTEDPVINKEDETGMIFLGFIILADPPKEGIEISLRQLRESGIGVKLITGDNELVAAHLSKQIGLESPTLLTGSALRTMTDEALVRKVSQINIFAETEPYQKERIVRALRKAGHVVGYIGDGINDVSAMKAADVSISVFGAVDVAKETADIVLLERDLDTLREGIHEGRKTFANTMKYIFITSSANFGNMFSMAVASIFLPFLPLLPKQILLTNFITDFPAMALSKDNVENERILKPTKWSPSIIRNFMIIFGIESSFFDMVTFGSLLFIFGTGAELFQTSWFVESVVTEILILLIIRTPFPVLHSKPDKYLLIISFLVIAITCLLPFSPFASSLGFTFIPPRIIVALIIITLLYCISAELTKKYFFRRLQE
ncbi:MAG TPA: magnesium-translocating P-type ATPase [Chryseosolibacter sp.]|nr:magnesium-translocating P-type ATPase [Chryseosolibacter sp.]